MRKRLQHSKSKFQTRIPAIIVMSLALCFILFWGKGFSDKVAGVFAPSVPVTDAVAVQDTNQLPAKNQPQTVQPGMTKTGTVVSKAYKDAAKSLLSLISNTRSN